MTNGTGFIDQAAQRAQGLPLARIVAAMLGVSAAFFALAMPPRIVSGLFGLARLSVAVGLLGQLVFALLFALLAATAGWLALTLAAGTARPAPTGRAPRPARKRTAATSSDLAPTLRRGDAHPDAPPRRPIFAKDDLGTPFDEIVTDRRIVGGAPEAEFATPDAPVDLGATIDGPPVEAAPVAPVAEPAQEIAGEDVPAIDETIAEEVSDARDEAEAIASEPDEDPADPAEETAHEPDARAESRPAAPREDDSIAALMARFEGGLGRLGGETLPPPDTTALRTLQRGGRDPDDALRDALEALQQMAARQR